jgi:hypothetical protein
MGRSWDLPKTGRDNDASSMMTANVVRFFGRSIKVFKSSSSARESSFPKDSIFPSPNRTSKHTSSCATISAKNSTSSKDD